MTNQDAFLHDLEDLRKEIDYLLSMVPIGKSKKDLQTRKNAEDAAGRARSTIACMRNDYIIKDCRTPPDLPGLRGERIQP